MKKSDSIIIDRMFPSWKASLENFFFRKDAYPEIRYIKVFDTDKYIVNDLGVCDYVVSDVNFSTHVVFDGWFFPETYCGDINVNGSYFYMWLPDTNGVCKITEDPAPFNKLMGYIDINNINRDLYTESKDHILYMAGLHRLFKVVFDCNG